MLKRFLEVLGPVEKVLIDFKMNKAALLPSEAEIEILKPVVKALAIVDASSRQLGARKTTLSSADFIFEKMIGELSKLDCPFARRLNGAVQTRIEERRLSVLSTLMAFLENPSFLSSTRGLHLTYADKNEIAKAAKDLLIDLKLEGKGKEPEDTEVEDPEDNPSEPASIPPQRSYSEELRDDLAERESATIVRPQSTGTTTTLTSIKKDIKKYEGTGDRPKSLEKVYNALRSIPPTSTGIKC